MHVRIYDLPCAAQPAQHSLGQLCPSSHSKMFISQEQGGTIKHHGCLSAVANGTESSET